MKEIKIVLNKDGESLGNNSFTVFIDGKPLENVYSIKINARQADTDIVDNNGVLRVDKLVSYTVQYREPWFD